MARRVGEWNRHEWKNNRWDTVINDKSYLFVTTSGVTVSGSLTVTGSVTSTDLMAGATHAYQFYGNQVEQEEFVGLTSSYIYLSSSDPANEFWHTAIPAVKSGSVVGMTLYSPDGTINGGALTGTVYVSDTVTTVTVALGTGTFGNVEVGRGTNTFNPGNAITVVITSSADFTSDVAASCSWVANVLVES